MARHRRSAQTRPAPRLKTWPTAAKAGQAPGTLQYVGHAEPAPAIATLIEYGPQDSDYRETQFTAIAEGRDFRPHFPILWLNIHGLSDIGLLRYVGEKFGLHELTLEDILHTEQRPKVELYPGYVFITTRLMHLDENGLLGSEQVSMVLSRRFVLTFQEKPTGTFNLIRESLKNSQSQVRKLGPDYLVYALLDKLVDRYFLVLEKLGERIEALEDAIIASPQPAQLTEIQALRRELVYLKRGLWPLREVINSLQHDEADLIDAETQLYLRDVYDHTVQLIESIETLRDVLGGLQDTHLSLQSHRMNQQMRMLTVITTIFMPLSLIAGIYGMNFDFMPELHWHWGYFAVLAAMLLIGVMLALIFRLRRWV